MSSSRGFSTCEYPFVGPPPATELLLEQAQYAYRVLEARLHGLTEAEFLWEPVAGCWSLRERGGRWRLEVQYPEPNDPPLTTIAWRLVHCSTGVHAAAAAVLAKATEGVLDVPEFAFEQPLDGALAAWRDGTERLERALASADGESLGREFAAPWAPRDFTPAWRFVAVLGLHEVVHHGAEIGCLRDLYRQKYDDDHEPAPSSR